MHSKIPELCPVKLLLNSDFPVVMILVDIQHVIWDYIDGVPGLNQFCFLMRHDKSKGCTAQSIHFNCTKQHNIQLC